MDTNKELIPKIADLYEKYIKSHPTYAMKKVKEFTIDFGNLDKVFDVFNYHIGWGGTKEGHSYYYILNMRWVIELSYLCHEFSNEYDNYCLGKIDYYYKFSTKSGYSFKKGVRYTRQQFIAHYEFYTKKIEKIKEIFGIVKN